MTAGDSHFQRTEELLDRLLDLGADEQDGFIEALRLEDPTMAARLDKLRQLDQPAEQFLTGVAETRRDSMLGATLAEVRAGREEPLFKAGDQISTYRIRCLVDRSARSEVYEADRTGDDWSDRVAIKVFRQIISDEQVRQRFLAERQILADLRNPGISILIDGGVNDQGRPYFVMEFIEGLTLDRYCQDSSVALEERLRLFREICSAVAYAHRHRVVHADIKPTNILVNREGQVKLLDFGISAIFEPTVDGSPQETGASRSMTPAYASPEQRRGQPLSTATDVYQLGLLLVTMLTGRTDPKRALGLDEDDALDGSPAGLRSMTGPELPYRLGSIDRDIDWIIRRSLQPDPGQRYGSANELLDDLNRLQDCLPVSARPATARYVLDRFVRRRPGLALSAALVLAGLIGFSVLLSLFNVNMDRQRELALEEASRAQETKSLLVEFLTVPDVKDGFGADTRVVDLLAHAERQLDQDFSHRPELRSELYGTLGEVYLSLDIPSSARPLFQKQISALQQSAPENAAALYDARLGLANSEAALGNHDSALILYRKLEDELQSRAPGDIARWANLQIRIAGVIGETVGGEASKAVLEPVVKSPQLEAEAPIILAWALGIYAQYIPDPNARIATIQRSIALREHHQGRHATPTLGARLQLAAALDEAGRAEESLAIYAETIPAMEREAGPLHSTTLNALNNQAVSLQKIGRLEEAAAAFRKVLDRRIEKDGRASMSVATSMQNLGALYNDLGQPAEAIPYLMQAAETYQSSLQPAKPLLAFPHISLATSYALLDQPSELESHASRAIELLEGNVSQDHPALLKSRCLLGDALIRSGQQAEGVPMVEAAIAGLKAQAGLRPIHVQQCQAVLESASDRA